MLASSIALNNPITWAIIIGWIFSVVLHEFAHGLVAYLGGDYTIRERGGLSLNPLQYVDPLNSLVLPTVFLLMGGIPLPGGVTYIRRDLIRSRAWNSAVSAAGPAMNLILFLLCALPFHPWLNLIDTSVGIDQYHPWQMFLAGMAQLQMIAVVINLMPIPPLDGFQMISPWMDDEVRIKLSTPPISTFAFLGFFLVLWKVPGVFTFVFDLTDRVLTALGFDPASQEMLRRGYNLAMFGSTD